MSQWTGWSMTSFYMPTIYRQAGIDNPAKAVFWTIVPNLANLLFTAIAIASVDRAGRRPLYLICAFAMTVTMSMLGLVFVFGIQGWPVVLVLSLTAAPHSIGLGALSWLVVSEIFPTRIRAKAMGFCTIWLWIGCWVVTFLAPVLFSLSQRLIGVPSGVFFLCAFTSLLSFFFILKMLPETKGRSLEEIAKSWTKK
jgi:MFS family permease